MQISVTILTKNGSSTLKKTLDSVREFDEVIILDNGSEDTTLEIAAQYSNVSIHHSPFIGFGPLHNLASSLAKHSWILSLDSDEVLTEELKTSLRKITLDENCIYRFERHNMFNGKWIKGCGWYPDSKVRLFHRDKTQFSPVQVHESVEENGLRTIHLEGAIEHTSYLTVEDLLRKMNQYSSLYAHEHRGKKRSSLVRAFLSAWFTFSKSYWIKQGFRDGKEGLVISLYNAQTTFYKHLKLMGENKGKMF